MSREFDVAPASDLYARMSRAIPHDHGSDWHIIGTVKIGDSGIAIGEPYAIPETEAYPFPECSAQFNALFLKDEEGDVLRVAGFNIIKDGAKPDTIQKTETVNFAIDSGNAFVACSRSLNSDWRPHEDDLSWNETTELPEDYQCSMDELLNELDRSAVAVLANGNKLPYLFSFPSGWGDGIYWLDELLENGEFVGYTCSFIEDAE